MKVICAWCTKVLKEGTGTISHGICPVCREELMRDIAVPALAKASK